MVSYLSAKGAQGTLCGVNADAHDAQGCTNLGYFGACAGNICGDSSSAGITCTAAANYLSTIINACADSSNEVYGTITTAEDPLLSIVVQSS